jgi:hypothetical protein
MKPKAYTCISPGCEGSVPAARRNIGRYTCLECGERSATRERTSWCVLTPHKQGAMFFTAEYAREAAVGINSKGGVVK